MRISSTRLLAVGLFGLLASMQALAQVTQQHFLRTIDALVLNSESVAIGKIVTARRNAGGVDAVIAVDETLKGNPQKTLLLHVPDKIESWDIEPFIKRTTEIEQLSKKNKPARLLVSENFYINLDSASLAIATADGNTLRESEKVISYAREVIHTHPGITKIQTVAFNGRMVPVDTQLEKRAIAAIESRGPDVNRYYDGVRAILFFKSDTNISLLKRLLDDPTSSIEGRNGALVRVYYVRQPAYNVLKKWDVPVAEPVLTEEIPKSQ